MVAVVKRLDIKHVLRDNSRAPGSQEKRDALWSKIVSVFNEICGTNCDIGKLKSARTRIMRAKRWNNIDLEIDKEVLSKYVEGDSQADSSIAEDEAVDKDEQKCPKSRHLSKTERITLVNLVKTFDDEGLLRKGGSILRAPENQAKWDAAWDKIVSAFNEISGTDFDITKLKRMLVRIKATPQWKAHSVLYDLDE